MERIYNLVITKKALNDIELTLFYITNTLHNKIAATNLYIKIEKTLQSICEFPYSFQTSETFYINNSKIRYATIKKYILFFKISEKNNRIDVLRFIHSKMDFSKK